ncbi:alpha-hydroxy acid oxidase [Comamonadaceae bacterium G21597-S1]|nr:alpha-hydroxy acid oxidase [Comamonadaceae bacterium G21597-S1]
MHGEAPRAAAPAPHRWRTPSVDALPQGIVSLADHARHAAQYMDANAKAYFDGAAADQITLDANAAAWQDWQLVPRVLRDLRAGHTRQSLLGRTLQHPILLAPVAYQRMAHADGELAAAHAAAAQGAGMVLSMQASVPMEAVAHAMGQSATAGPLWFQLYLQQDRGFVRALVQQAEDTGFQALVLTVDAPVHGARDQERRFGFRLPDGVSAVNLTRLRRSAVHGQAVPPGALCAGLMQQAPRWDDVAWLLQQTRLPVLVKGILHPDDALLARDMGVAGIIVSNHGGRTLDTAWPSACALPAVAQALEGALPILVDGGIRRGTDVLKALALGASAVLIGRPVIHGLVNAGAVGVAHVLKLLRDELEIAMALSGCAQVSDANPALLRSRTGQHVR